MNTPIKSTDSGWRGSADGWLEAAYESLIESGIEAVRILPLAKRLKLSRTSFYWFFKDRDELLAALLERWRVKNTESLVSQSQAYAESLAEATLNVFDCWLNPALFDSQFEFAVRSWALQDACVAAQVEIADKTRLAALAGLFVRFGYEALPADVRARSLYLTQIGYISMNSREDVLLRMQRIPEYVRVFTGQEPQARELQRFYARHGYALAEQPVLVSITPGS
ncbi:TetR/AcrR family transcriptional regulator [Pseudomonas guguanensis]|uniref:TetR/AcrR family transcriptional regulator n=1 Tax=Ectopseudomonas guguanensis TaxID=1198456 RepID=UPI00326435B8